MSIEGREKFLDWAVDQMNQWMAIIACDSRDAEVVVMYKQKNGKMAFMKKTFASLLNLIGHIKVFHFNEDQKKAVELHGKLVNAWQHGHANNPAYGGNQTLLPKLPPKKKAEKGDEGVIKEVDDLQLELKSLVKLWQQHPKHKVFTETVFNPRPVGDPKGPGPHQLNLWSGFDITRESVNDLKFRHWQALTPLFNHIRYSWCDTDEQFFYLINWMANLIQRPWDKQGTSIMVKGPPGSGKSMIWLLLCRIIGEAHSAHIQDMNDVLGDFNAPLTNKIFVFMDEVKITDDKMMDLFKNLVTGSTARCHKKFADAKYEDSHLHIATSTNRDEFLKVEEKDRRVLALTSDIEALLKHPYFRQLQLTSTTDYFDFLLSSLDNTFEDVPEFGLKVFANFLYNWPIEETYDPRKIPGSMLLWDQKKKNLDPVPAFWFNCLKQGFVYKNEGAFAATSDQIRPDVWLNSVAFDEVWKEYSSQNYLKEKKSPKNKEDFWTRLEKYLPPDSKKTVQNNAMLRASFVVIELPSLKICRDHFDQVVPGMSWFFELEDLRKADAEEATHREKNLADRNYRIKELATGRLMWNFPPRSEKSQGKMDPPDPRWPIMNHRVITQHDNPVKRNRIEAREVFARIKQTTKKKKANQPPPDEQPLMPRPVRCAWCGTPFSRSPFPYFFDKAVNKWRHQGDCPDPADELHWNPDPVSTGKQTV